MSILERGGPLTFFKARPLTADTDINKRSNLVYQAQIRSSQRLGAKRPSETQQGSHIRVGGNCQSKKLKEELSSKGLNSNSRRGFTSDLKSLLCCSMNRFLRAIAVKRWQSSTTLIVGDEMARLDLSRAARCGFPEVVFGEGKSAKQISDIFKALYDAKSWPIIATRVSVEQVAHCRSQWTSPHALLYDEDARIMHVDDGGVGVGVGVGVGAKTKDTSRRLARISVLSAGTSDYRVASEAALLLKLTLPPTAATVQTINDVGVAGLHRLLTKLPSFQDSDCLIVVAGMEGALSSVVGGPTVASYFDRWW